MSSREAPELAGDAIARQRTRKGDATSREAVLAIRADILATFGGAAARDALYPDEAGAEHVIELACVQPCDPARLAYFREAPGLYRIIALHAPSANVSTDRQERKS